MRKNAMILGLVLVTLLSGCKKEGEQNKEARNEAAVNQQEMKKENIYQFKVNDLYGSEFDFSTLKGKKVMVVNTASECGLTPQYADLQKLYDKYKDKDFVIVGFPANNFGGLGCRDRHLLQGELRRDLSDDVEDLGQGKR